MDNKEQMTYELKSKINSLNFDIASLDKFIDKIKKITDSYVDKGKMRGNLLGNVDINKTSVLNDDLNKLVDSISRRVNTYSHINLDNKLDSKTLETYQKALKMFENYQDSLTKIQNNVDTINQYDTGRLNARDYSKQLNTDISNYQNQYQQTFNKYKTTISSANSVIRRSLNGSDKDEVSYTFDKKLQEDYQHLIDNDVIGETGKELKGYISSNATKKAEIEKAIQEDKESLKGYHSNEEVMFYRKRIAENKKRLHDLDTYDKKILEIYDEITTIEESMTKAYNNYSNSGTLVAPSRYSFMGQLKRTSNRIMGSIAFQTFGAIASALQQGNTQRINNFDNGVGSTMYQLYSSGDKKLDNRIQEYVDNLGIDNGTHVKGSDTTRLLGAYTQSNRTGNVNDYKEQINESTIFSSHTGTSIDNTANLISSLGFSGVTNQKDVLKNIYGSLANSGMISRSNEQVQGLSSMFSNLSNVGNLTTTQANNMVDYQQMMASTHDSALQGEQGANAYNAFTNTLTDTKHSVMRNIGAQTFGIKLGSYEGSYFDLQLKMEQARKDPKMTSKLVKNLTKYYGDEKATAFYISKYSEGKLSVSQAYKLVHLSNSGKLTKKKLDNLTKNNKEAPLKKNLDNALKGSGNFEINLYLSVDQKVNNSTSMKFDGIRNISNNLFKNHPILKNIATVGGSVLTSTLGGVVGSMLSSKVSKVFKLGNSGGGVSRGLSQNVSSGVTSGIVSNASKKVSKVSLKGFSNGKGGKLLGSALLPLMALNLANRGNKQVEETKEESKKNSKKSKKVSSITEKSKKDNKENNLLALENAYFVRGIRVVEQALTIANIIKTDDSSSSSSSSDSDNSNDDKEKDKSSDSSKKDDKKKDNKKDKDKKNDSLSSLGSSIDKDIDKEVDKVLGSVSKLARGGFINNLLRNDSDNVDLIDVDDLRSNSGYDSLDQPYDRKASDIRELHLKYDNYKNSSEPTSRIKKNIKPTYNVNLNIPKNKNYNHYVSVINKVLENYTNTIVNAL